MKKLLIITTVNDGSLPLFFLGSIGKKIFLEVCLISDSRQYLLDKISSRSWDYIYLRDPFTDTRVKPTEIVRKIKMILESKGKAYMVDRLENPEDVFFEDKWKQYELLGDLMPNTAISDNAKGLEGNLIFKKRISSRGRGVCFERADIRGDLSEYIAQEKLLIQKEYRVIVLFGKVVEMVEEKSPKSQQGKVKVLSAQPISEALLDFSKRVAERLKFDFVGMDVAEIASGEYRLLEVNRSCLFSGFYKFTGINLADKFVDGLLKKK